MSEYEEILAGKLRELRAEYLEAGQCRSDKELLPLAEYAAQTELILRFPLLYHQHDTQQ